MNKLKILVSLFTITVITLFSGGFSTSAESTLAREGSFEIPVNSITPYANSYYSKSLVTLNIATAGVSNLSIVTSGSVPNNAKITKVELKGNKSVGSGLIYWYITYNKLNLTSSTLFASPATFSSFNGLDANSSWTVWIEGANWSTVTGGNLKVYYSY